MKKITAILIFSIYLFYTTGFHELLKINTLVQHFYETEKNDSTISFYQFLVMHYITDDLNDKDNDRDRQLPFKSANTHTSNTTTCYIFDLKTPSLVVKSFITSKPVNKITKDLFIDTDFNSIVWHPPKNA